MVGRHYFCFQSVNGNVVMIVEDNFFAEPKQYPSTVTVAEICERFAAASFPCKAERHEDEGGALLRWLIAGGGRLIR